MHDTTSLNYQYCDVIANVKGQGPVPVHEEVVGFGESH